MYPLQCRGTFFNPAKVGTFSIVGFQASVSDLTADARLALIDDVNLDSNDLVGLVYGTDPVNVFPIIDKQAQADQEGNLEAWFPEPIKIRHGISIGAGTTNIVGGTLKVYAR